MKRTWIAVLLASGMLAACGGSGSSVNEPVAPPEPVEELTIVGPSSVSVGDGIALWADADTGSNRRFDWQQLSGPAVNISNPSSPMASFAVTQSGSYQFQVEVDDEIATFSFTAGASDDGINSYSDQTVASGTRVSLRAEALDPLATEFPSNLRWSKISGPAISDIGNQEPELYTFTAPYVSSDTEIQFRLTGNANGTEGSDIVSVRVTADPRPVTNAYFNEPLARVMPYKADSEWATGLNKCVYHTQFNTECAVSELPLIGQVESEPSIELILDRLLVSHPWMGQQFETLLRQYDPHGDFRRLLAGVTAVVISSDVRPSFYWVVTGAIYLDPDNLWQYPWQRSTINEDPDYRSGFGNDLQFLIPWRYVKGNEYANLAYPAGAKLERPWEQIEPDIASLLYHELAHANDFFPRSTHGSISASSLLQEYLNRIEAGGLPSDSLTNSYPLASNTMMGLAQVSFAGNTATTAQKNLSPDDVASDFFNDRASDYYPYSTRREDLAMLFEETMMQRRYGIYRDVAVTSLRSTDPALDLIVSQGQRGRVGETAIRPRVQLVFDQLLPEVGDISNDLAAPQNMTSGLNWFDAIVINPNANRLFVNPSSLQQPSGLKGKDHFGPRHQHRHPH